MSALITMEPIDALHIGLAAAELGWDRAVAFVRETHHPVLAPLPDSGGKYKGIFWHDSTATVRVADDDFGPGQEAALAEFREFLHQQRHATQLVSHQAERA
jgi:hypothetical protein